MSEETQDPQDAPAGGIYAAPPPFQLSPMAAVPQPTATFDDLVQDDSSPSSDGKAILAALGEALKADEVATAAGSYGFDKELAESGKWFRWPKLGPKARVKLCKLGCKAWDAVLNKARKRYGDADGTINADALGKIIEPMMAKALFVGMEDVILELDADGKPSAPLADSEEARLRLMEQFSPDLHTDLLKVANNPKNFRDLSEDVLGN